MDAPEWAHRLKPGYWYSISGDRPDPGLSPTPPGSRYLEDGDPASDLGLNPNHSLSSRIRHRLGRTVKAPWSGRCGFYSITEAWNGAVYASHYGEAGGMVIYGGGHNDYFGSDVHAFDLAQRQWQRISDGYVTGAIEQYGAGAVYPEGEYPDGSPLPPHTYGYVQYDEAGNDLLIFKSQLELGEDVKPLSIPHLFNLSSGTWRRGPLHPSAYLGAGGWTAWDEKRRVLWGNSGDASNYFLGFAPDGENPDGSCGHWCQCFPGKLPGTADHSAMAYDPVADRLLVIAHVADALALLVPGDPGKPLEFVASAGQPRLSAYAALEYSPRLDSLIYYSACDGDKVWRVQRHSMDWSRATWSHLTEPGNPLDPVQNALELSRHPVHKGHTFGRFRLAGFKDMDLAVLVRHVDTPVYVMRVA